jgi:hypothetical protein
MEVSDKFLAKIRGRGNIKKLYLKNCAKLYSIELVRLLGFCKYHPRVCKRCPRVLVGCWFYYRQSPCASLF